MNASLKEKKEFTFHWGWRIAAIYTAFALATLGFMLFSLTQKVELVSVDYYKEELNFDKNITAKNNALLLPSAIIVKHENNSLLIEFPNLPQTASLLLYRPSTSLFDKEFSLYRNQLKEIVDISHLQSGLWIAKIHWTSNNKDYYSEYRFTK